MFLMERLIGVSIYSYILIMICLLIAFSRIKCKNLLGIYLILLGGMGYFYTPYITADLYRIYEAMEWYATIPFGEFFHSLVIPSSVPVSRILFWLVGKTGVPRLLPMISSFWCYSCIFYILEKTRKKFSISRENTAITLFFMMCSSIFISVIGGIRMMLSISLIAFCFFRESVEEKHNIIHLIFCVMAVFIHDMGLSVLSLAVIALVFDKRKSPLSKIILSFLCVGIAFVGVYLFRGKILDVFDKFTSYILEVDYYDIWEYMMGGIYVVFFLFICAKYNPYYKQYLQLNSLHTASLITAGVALICCYDFSIFYRFIGHVLPIFALPVLMVTLQYANQFHKSRFKVVSLQLTVILISLVLLFIGGSRGSLSALKFFVIN